MASDKFHDAHLLIDARGDPILLPGLVSAARVGVAALRGVDLLESDDSLERIRVLARPLAGLMALAPRRSGGVAEGGPG